MEEADKALLSACAEAVLVVTGAVQLDGYAHWEELVDFVCDLHERLNDLKPAYSKVTTEE